MTNEDNTPQEPVERDRLVTIRETAQTLGISVRALYRLIASGELPAPLKVGRASRVLMTEIHAYIERLKAERDTVARRSWGDEPCPLAGKDNGDEPSWDSSYSTL